MLRTPRHAQGTLGGVAHHPDELVSELLPGGAVQKEIHRVVDVHQHLGDGARQAELGDTRQVLLEGVTEGGRYAGDVHRERCEEEGERDRQQHDRQTGVALGRRSTLLSHAAVQLADAGRAQFVAMVARLHHLANDERVQGADGDKRQERVDEHVDPRPHILQ